MPDDLDEVVVRTEAGYLLRAAPDQLDALVFRREFRTAQEHQRSGRPGEAIATVESALRRWRGEPFSGLDSPYPHAHRLAGPGAVGHAVAGPWRLPGPWWPSWPRW